MSTRTPGLSPRRLWLALPWLVACGSGDSSSLGTTVNPSAGGASGTGGSASTGGQAGQAAGTGGATGPGGSGAGTGPSAGSAGAGGAAGGGGTGSAGASGASMEPPAAASLVSQSEHTCARLASGKLTCWGWNFAGQLGLGDMNDRGDQPGEMGASLAPIDLGNGAQVAAVATGFGHTCAVLADGRVRCWGVASYGVLGLGDMSSNPGDQPGEMGDNLPAVDLGAGAHAIDISSGSTHTCALLDTGKVKCWGANAHGELGLGDIKDRGDQPGQMGDSLPFVDLGAGARAVAVRAGGYSSCALLDTGKVKCWGMNDRGQLGLGDKEDRGDQPGEMGDALPFVDLGDARAVSLVVGFQHACALLEGGKIKCWGGNYFGELGLGDEQARGDQPGEMGAALPTVDLGAATAVTRMAVGAAHTCAVLTTGQVKCWGCQTSSQLGTGDIHNLGDGPGEMGDALPFVDLGAGLGATDIGAGYQHTCVRLTTGQVKCWGLNYYGELGLGDTGERGRQPGQMGDALSFVDLSSAVGP